MKALLVSNKVAKQLLATVTNAFANETAVAVQDTKLYRISIDFAVTDKDLSIDGETYKIQGFADGKAITFPMFYRPEFYNQITTVKPYTEEEKAEFFANRELEKTKNESNKEPKAKSPKQEEEAF